MGPPRSPIFVTAEQNPAREALAAWFSLNRSLIAMVGASVGSSYALVPQCHFSVPLVLQRLQAWSAFFGSFGPWCPLSSSPASCKALKSTPAMLYIPAPYAELTSVLPPILFLSANAAFRASAPSANVSKCCSHCLLCCEVASGMFPLPRLLARSNDVTSAQVDSIVLWAVVLPGGVTHPEIQ